MMLAFNYFTLFIILYSICLARKSKFSLLLKVVFDPKIFKVINNKIVNEEAFRELNAKYFKNFEDSFIQDVKRLIDREQQKKKLFQEFSYEDKELVDEINLHLSFCAELSEKFIGREELVEKVI